MLIDSGADLDLVDEFGWGALFSAVKGNTTIVKYLLANGVKTDGKNSDGQTVPRLSQRLESSGLIVRPASS